MSDQINYLVTNRVATITLNRPEARNALSAELTAELIRMVRAADSDPDVKCLLIRGQGEHFSAGGDVKSFEQTLALPPEERFDNFERRLLVGNRLPQTLLDCGKPVVVATRGAVAGAGMTLCLAADFVVCGESSYFIAAHVLVGLSLDCGLSGLLVAGMGIKAAKRMALLGERVDAAQALALGLVSEVVADASLDERIDKLTSRLAGGPATAMAATKRLLNQAAIQNFTEQLAAEASLVARCAATEDFRKGVEGAVNRKPAVFD